MVELTQLIPLFIYLSVAIAISFLCSLLEAVFLSVNQPYIELMIKEKKKAGPLLKELKSRTDRSLAAILSLNTIAHTIGAAGVGAEVLKLFGSAWVAVASAILTLLILVFSEIIPKSIGAANWKRMAPFAARTIKILITLLIPLVVMLEKISHLFQPKGFEEKLTRDEMIATAEMGKRQGIIDKDEARIIRNLLRLDNIMAEDIMTPRTVMFTFHKDQTVEEVVKQFTPIRFSRIPVQDKGIDDIKGVVLRVELLRAYYQERFNSTMKDIMHPVETARPDDSVGILLDRFIEVQEHLFLVVDEYGATVGIITLEDTIETLLGVEIVDEQDSVEDMRKFAREIWEKRRQMWE